MISDIQWKLSITDTLGNEKQFVMESFPLLICIAAMCPVPQKQSAALERFAINRDIYMS